MCYIQVIPLCGQLPACSQAPIKNGIHHPSTPLPKPSQLHQVPPGAAASGGLSWEQAQERFGQRWVGEGGAGSSHGRGCRANFWLIIIWTFPPVFLPAAISRAPIPTRWAWECAEAQIRNLKNQTLHIPLCFQVISFLYNSAWYKSRKNFCCHYFQGKWGFSAILKFKISLP